jgi:SAM-dependent methyltransferase
MTADVRPGKGAEPTGRMTVDEAVRLLRTDPASSDLVRDAYLGRDVVDSARRFATSSEFAEVLRVLGPRLDCATVLDLGAGSGIASLALLGAGAQRVLAVEPDPSDEVGRGAIARLDPDERIEIRDGFGEDIPADDASVDIVYARQVLHHATDLRRVLHECARVLRPGGLLLACREHVVEGPDELAAFLAAHPVHRLAGGENAFSLAEYLGAIDAADLVLDQVIGPWDSVINAFPAVRSADDLRNHARDALARRWGLLGRLASHAPWVQSVVRRRIQPDAPGRMYTFVAHRRVAD